MRSEKIFSYMKLRAAPIANIMSYLRTFIGPSWVNEQVAPMCIADDTMCLQLGSTIASCAGKTTWCTFICIERARG